MNGDVNIRLTGSFNLPELRLQGDPIALRFDGEQTWERLLRSFDLKGLLHVGLCGRGRRGSSWKLRIEIEDQPPLELQGKMEEVFLGKVWEVPVV